MKPLLSIIRYTFLQQFRNRLYLVVVLFGFLMMAASLLFGAVAADQEVRVILDLGLGTAEMFGLAAAIFGAVTLILEEMESRTIYLILTRPLPRPLYILGRFLGLLAAVWVSVGIMEIVHFGLLYAKGWQTDLHVLMALPLMGLKIMVMTALAVVCSLLFTSAATAVVFTLFFWVLGHFGQEMTFLAQKSGNALTGPMIELARVLLPNLTLLNLRDLLDVPGGIPQIQMVQAILYAVVYSGACLALSTALFAKREF